MHNQKTELVSGSSKSATRRVDPEATPLARTLSARKAAVRVTPLDLFALARRKWIEGERLDIGRLAKELGVGRATVFRWVGSREQLYGEILAAGYAHEVQRARREVNVLGLKGVEYITEVTRRVMRRLLNSVPLRRFIEQDPEFAIRVLTSKSSPTQQRCIEVQRKLLAELEEAGEIRPTLDPDTLAYIIVRIGESFLYGDVISGRAPDVDKATDAISILVAARRPDNA